MSLAQRVRDYRYTKGWGPDELASRAEISRTALYQIESGKTELPRAGTLRRIALALDVSMETLLGHTDAATATAAMISPTPPRASSSVGDWFPSEGGPLSGMAARSVSVYEATEGNRFLGKEYLGGQLAGQGLAAVFEPSPQGRERDLTIKLRELLASPLGESVARIVEETHRLLPQSRFSGV